LNYKKFTAIALKILSLYIFIQSLIHLSRIASYYIIPLFTVNIKPQEESLVNLIVNFIPFLVLVVVGLFLWVYSEKFASIIIKENQQTSLESTNINYQELQSVAFSVVGVVVTTIALPEFFTAVGSLINFLEIGRDYATNQFKIEITFHVIEKVIKLILGVGLFFGGRGLTNLLARIRKID